MIEGTQCHVCGFTIIVGRMVYALGNYICEGCVKKLATLDLIQIDGEDLYQHKKSEILKKGGQND